MRIKLSSTNLLMIEYQDGNNMWAMFRGGSEFIFTPISEDVFNELKDSEDPDLYFKLNIQNNSSISNDRVG